MHFHHLSLIFLLSLFTFTKTDSKAKQKTVPAVHEKQSSQQNLKHPQEASLKGEIAETSLVKSLGGKYSEENPSEFELKQLEQDQLEAKNEIQKYAENALEIAKINMGRGGNLLGNILNPYAKGNRFKLDDEEEEE